MILHRLFYFSFVVFVFTHCAPKSNTNSESLASTDGKFDSKVIYGTDNRQDIYQITNSMYLGLADSTVALMHPTDIQAVGQTYKYLSTDFGDAYNLCASEPFRAQPVVAFCSGSLVAPDTILTAGHCVQTQDDCNNLRVAFNFAVKKQGVYPATVSQSEVYSCQSVIHSEINQTGADFALIKLDRPVTNHKPLALRRSGNLNVGDSIFVIGYPAGIPVKVDGGKNVRAVGNGFYVGNTDTYGGNSGSPVFDANGLVSGVLVRGETDFVVQGDCEVSHVCPANGCRGEDFTMISNVFQYL